MLVIVMLYRFDRLLQTKTYITGDTRDQNLLSVNIL